MKLNDKQKLILEFPARKKIVIKGRRAGGNFLCGQVALEDLRKNNDVLWMSPNYRTAMSDMRDFFSQNPDVKRLQSAGKLRHNGAMVRFCGGQMDWHYLSGMVRRSDSIIFSEAPDERKFVETYELINRMSDSRNIFICSSVPKLLSTYRRNENLKMRLNYLLELFFEYSVNSSCEGFILNDEQRSSDLEEALCRLEEDRMALAKMDFSSEEQFFLYLQSEYREYLWS